jgi:hypothetical protein
MGAECLIAVVAMLFGILCYGAGGRRADGSGRTLVWAVAGALFFLVAVWFGLVALGGLST